MEKKQIKMSLGTFIAIMVAVILVVVVVFMGIHIANQNKQIEESKITVASNEKEETTKNSEITTNTANTNNAVAKELDINNDLVQNLYGYICEKYPEDVDEDGLVEKNTYIPTLNCDTLLSYYRSEKITNNTLEDDLKLLVTLKSLLLDKKYTTIKQENLESIYSEDFGVYYKTMNFEDSYYYNFETQKYEKSNELYYIDSDVYTFDMDNIQAKAKEIFNTKINIQKHSFKLLGDVFVYDNNTYKYFFQSEGGGTYLVLDDTKLIKAEQKGDEIYIYDNYIRVDLAAEEGIPVYASSDEKMRLRVNLSDIKDIPETKIVWERMKQQGTGIPLYKHTFKKSNTGTYYWVSSELINKNELKTIN